jgi:membrane protease subunit (stomatin/prohibitin family)
VALLGREFIAVPDDKKGQIVFKWPDVSIRRFTRAIVDADEVAFFINTGRVVQTMGPGRHQIDANELPGLGILIDAATGGNAYRAELYFVSNREFTRFNFGGRVDDVQDPHTGMIVTLRVFGDYAMRVIDPVVLVTNLLGTVDVTDNEKVSGWISDQLLKTMRTDVTRQIVRNGWPILGLSAYSPEIEQSVITATNQQLAAYGVAITRMGNFDINLSEDDEKQLKTLAKDTSYSRLAGGFNQYAAGEMALGAGQGMAKGGEGVAGAFLGLGLNPGAFGAGGAQGGQPAGPTPPPQTGFAGAPGNAYVGPQPAAVGATCASCGTVNPGGGHFCMGCGQSLAPQGAHCANCGAELAAGARFCGGCGTPTAPAPAPAPNAGAPYGAPPAGNQPYPGQAPYAQPQQQPYAAQGQYGQPQQQPAAPYDAPPQSAPYGAPPAQAYGAPAPNAPYGGAPTAYDAPPAAAQAPAPAPGYGDTGYTEQNAGATPYGQPTGPTPFGGPSVGGEAEADNSGSYEPPTS